MAIRGTALVGAVVTLSLALAAPAAAQGKKKPSSLPGTATFRCTGTAGDCPGSPAPDRILGQHTTQNPDITYPGSGVPESGRGAHLRPGNEMWLGLRDGFTVRLDFSERVGLATCDPWCKYDEAFGGTDTIVIGETSYAEFQTNVVDDLDETDTTPTLMDVSTDPQNPSPVRLHISFYDSTGRLWNFNFSNARNSGAENASVWRSGPCAWVITDGGSLAELSTLVKLNGKQFRSYEGLYAAPFEITFTAPGCPMP